MTRTRRFGSSLGLATILAVAVVASPAAAAPSTPDRQPITATLPDAYRKQIPLQKAAGVIRSATDNQAGFAGLELEDASVTLWWKGALPAKVADAVEAATVPVAVKDAAYTLNELRAAGRSLRGALKGQQLRVKYAVDGSRVVLGVETKAGLRIPSVNVPVEVVEQGRKADASRLDDWAPWAGGADIINNSVGARCTSGFGVRNGANQRFLLTAGHCGSNGQEIRDGVGEYIGYFTADNDGHDLGMVATGSVINQVYVGDLYSNAAVNVEGWDWVFPGEFLCQSGGSSARDVGRPVCNLRVERFNSDPGDAVEARQTTGEFAVRPGDSGGPLYSFSGSGNAIAKGITNYYYPSDRSIIGFQDFGTAWRDYGIWIAIG